MAEHTDTTTPEASSDPDVALVRDALWRGDQDSQLLDGREYNVARWEGAFAALDRLAARLSELERERDGALNLLRQSRDRRKGLVEAERRVQVLTEALGRYGTHEPGCGRLDGYGTFCTCGLERAWAVSGVGRSAPDEERDA